MTLKQAITNAAADIFRRQPVNQQQTEAVLYHHMKNWLWHGVRNTQHECKCQECTTALEVTK